jgi:hypothetical protein
MTEFTGSFHARGTRSRTLNQVRGWLTVVLAFLFLALCQARADDREDQYMRIYEIIKKADSAQTNAQPAQALARYREAQTALARLQQTYPDWNAKAVSFRLAYVNQKVAALSQPAAPPPQNTDSSPGTNATQKASDTKPTAASGTLHPKLLQPGNEPRKPLRFHPKPGDKQTVSLTMKMAIGMKMGEVENPPMKLPAIITSFEVSIKNLSPNGDIAYDLLIGDTTIANDSEALPQIVDAMKTAVGAWKGLSGSGTVSDRGINKSLELKMPQGADAQTRQTLEQLKDSLTRIIVPVPEEPLGVGAKWEVKGSVKSQGMSLDQTSVYEITAIAEDKISTKNTITQKAAPQKISSPAMPGLKLDLTKMNGNGSGDLTLNLAQLMSPQASVQLHTDAAMAMNTGGQKQNMNMTADLTVKVESK